MTDISLLSAPWLLLAFFAGVTQRESRRAALLGIGCIFSALIGYGAMTLSPVESAHMSVGTIGAFVGSEGGVFIGGMVTGPLFAWFGQRWRVHRAWRGALVTAAALSFEPLARIPTGHGIRSSTVLLTEVAVGIAMAAYVATRMLVSPQTGLRRGHRAP
jgi:hypothetical protein